MTVPLVDLARQHAQVEQEILAGWRDVLDHGQFVLGPEVEEFERALAAFCRVAHCIGVGNGTDALELALRAFGIGPGDSVIVPTNSFIASALAVLRTGADVLLVDADPDHYLIDVGQTTARLEPSVKAVMAVHLYGQAAPVEMLSEVAGGRVIVEDAAQAQGAARFGRRTGSLGTVGATSFYPGKNLGAYGDAGAVLTPSTEIAQRVRALRNWGSRLKYRHPVKGFNSRLDTMQSVVLIAKLRLLEQWNSERRSAAALYADMLRDLEPVQAPRTLSGNDHVWHLFVVLVPDRDLVAKKMRSEGVEVGIHYPIPIHLQGAMSHLGHREGDFPVAEMLGSSVLSLPLFPGITEGEQERVVATLRGALRI